MELKRIFTHIFYLIVIAMLIFTWGCYRKVVKNFNEDSIQYSSEVTKYLNNRYNDGFIIDKIIRNDSGLTAYCYPETNKTLLFTVSSSYGQIFYDTYIQASLENECNKKVGQIVAQYTENYNIRSVLKFYHDISIGDQKDVLYEKYQKLGRVPLLEDVLEYESIDKVYVDIYDIKNIDLKEIAKEIKKIPLNINIVDINRYTDLNCKEKLDSFSENG